MSLPPGSRVGPYEVTGALGTGGMGEVFRARDTKLNRDVAIKVLPAEFASDPERVARFRREAQILASLNHRNIAGIYGLEETAPSTLRQSSAQARSGAAATVADAARAEPGRSVEATVCALVMEYVDGEDLAQRLSRGAIPVDEAIAIAKQIVDALDEAHERGIIHRDLKPANIKVTSEGKVKVLDFGLAKAMDPGWAEGRPADVSHSPTLTRHGTSEGTIIGTAAYMSPEQARGKAVDKRGDIWAFGVVLFEMLSGRRLFAGETVSDILAAVLTREPDWMTLPAGLHPAASESLRRCLDKDPRRRLRDIGDFRLTGDAATPIARATISARRKAAIAAGLLGLGVLAGWLLRGPEAKPAPPVSRLSILLPEGRPYLVDTYPGRSIAISDDGTKIAWVARDLNAAGGRRIMLRSLDSLEAHPVVGAEDAFQPFFSPDGAWLAYFSGADRALKKVSLSGGPPVTIVRDLPVPAWTTGVWTKGGLIAFDDAQSIAFVSDQGGAPTRLSASPMSGLGVPQPLPAPDEILYTAFKAEAGLTYLEARALSGDRRRVLVEDAEDGHFLGPGHLLFNRGGALLVTPFGDASPGKATVPVALEVKVDNRNTRFPLRQLAVSGNGTLAYVPATGRLERESSLSWRASSGSVSPIGTINVPVPDLRLSPDGKRVAAARRLGNKVRYEVIRLDGLTSTLVADVDATYPAVPVWQPDGRHIVVTRSGQGGDELWSYDVDGGGTPERMVAFPKMNFVSPHCYSPDGRYLTVTAYGENSADVLIVDSREKGPNGVAVRAFVGSKVFEAFGCFSPDGGSIAYVSEESGGGEVYVRSFPGGENVTRVSRQGGFRPRWSPRGDELYFIAGKGLMASRVGSSSGNLTFGAPRDVYGGEGFTGVDQGTAFDVAADGRLLIRTLPEDPYTSREIVVIQNWFEEVRQLAAAR